MVSVEDACPLAVGVIGVWLQLADVIPLGRLIANRSIALLNPPELCAVKVYVAFWPRLIVREVVSTEVVKSPAWLIVSETGISLVVKPLLAARSVIGYVPVGVVPLVTMVSV